MGFGIIDIHAPTKSPDPQNTALILADHPGAVIADAIRVGLIEKIRIKPVSFPIVTIQTAPCCCNPQSTLPVLIYTANAVAADAARIIGIMLIMGELPVFRIVSV